MDRFTDCQVKWSSSTLVMMLVLDTFWPSRSVEVLVTVHLSPSLLQAPSLKPPVESKDQERTCLPAASQPIHWMPPPTGTSFSVVPKEATRKFWFWDQE